MMQEVRDILQQVMDALPSPVFLGDERVFEKTLDGGYAVSIGSMTKNDDESTLAQFIGDNGVAMMDLDIEIEYRFKSHKDDYVNKSLDAMETIISCVYPLSACHALKRIDPPDVDMAEAKLVVITTVWQFKFQLNNQQT